MSLLVNFHPSFPKMMIESLWKRKHTRKAIIGFYEWTKNALVTHCFDWFQDRVNSKVDFFCVHFFCSLCVANDYWLIIRYRLITYWESELRRVAFRLALLRHHWNGFSFDYLMSIGEQDFWLWKSLTNAKLDRWLSFWRTSTGFWSKKQKIRNFSSKFRVK